MRFQHVQRTDEYLYIFEYVSMMTYIGIMDVSGVHIVLTDERMNDDHQTRRCYNLLIIRTYIIYMT